MSDALQKTIDDERSADVDELMKKFREGAKAMIAKHGDVTGGALVMATVTSIAAEWLLLLNVNPRVYFDRVNVTLSSLIAELMKP